MPSTYILTTARAWTPTNPGSVVCAVMVAAVLPTTPEPCLWTSNASQDSSSGNQWCWSGPAHATPTVLRTTKPFSKTWGQTLTEGEYNGVLKKPTPVKHDHHWMNIPDNELSVFYPWVLCLFCGHGRSVISVFFFNERSVDDKLWIKVSSGYGFGLTYFSAVFVTNEDFYSFKKSDNRSDIVDFIMLHSAFYIFVQLHENIL